MKLCSVKECKKKSRSLGYCATHYMRHLKHGSPDIVKVTRNFGPENGLWKGDQVSYRTLHEWVNFHKPKPKDCEKCHKNKRLEAANISGKYLRDISDYKWLCRKCHMESDGRFKNLKQYKDK
jgi:hypothetical protein